MIKRSLSSIEAWQRRHEDRKYPPAATGEVFLEEWKKANAFAHRNPANFLKEQAAFPGEVEKLREKYIGARIVVIVAPELRGQERKDTLFQTGRYTRVCGKLGLLRETAYPLFGDYDDMVIPKADVGKIQHWNTTVERTDNTGWILGKTPYASGVIEGLSVWRNTMLISDAATSRGYILPVLRGGCEPDATQTPAIRISELTLPPHQLYLSDYLAEF
jgi:hypothetical protein